MKTVAIICFVLALAVVGKFAMDCSAAGQLLMATRLEIPVEVVETDAFGDEVKTTRWEDGLQLGLMDGAGPATGGLVFVGVGLLWLDRRRRRAAAA